MRADFSQRWSDPRRAAGLRMCSKRPTMASARASRPETKGCQIVAQRPPCVQAASKSARKTSIAWAGDFVGMPILNSRMFTYCGQSSSE